jgi:photosystem II stability/assembly factor-like uncharacterized protein
MIYVFSFYKNTKMKSLFAGVFLFVFFASCSKDYKPRKLDNVYIKEFKIDSTSIRTLVAIDSLTMYYAGSNGHIGFTNNGGETWHTKQLKYQDSISPNFRSMAYNVNTNLVYALSIANPALLYQYNFSDTHIVYEEKHPKVFYDSMKFFDAKHGIAMGDPTDGNCLSIILTNDGGNTWNKIPCEQIPKVEDGEAAFAASNTNIKVLGNTVWIVTGGMKSRVFKSIDLGITWNVYETPIIQGSSSEGIYSIDFFDEKNGIVIGGDYSKPKKNLKNKAITFDGGQTWALVADGQNPNYKSCVQYVPNTEGKEIFAVGKTGISYSNNGGLNWDEVNSSSYYSIQFVDKNTAWLTGNNKIGKLIIP